MKCKELTYQNFPQEIDLTFPMSCSKNTQVLGIFRNFKRTRISGGKNTRKEEK